MEETDYENKRTSNSKGLVTWIGSYVPLIKYYLPGTYQILFKSGKIIFATNVQTDIETSIIRFNQQKQHRTGKQETVQAAGTRVMSRDAAAALMCRLGWRTVLVQSNARANVPIDLHRNTPNTLQKPYPQTSDKETETNNEINLGTTKFFLNHSMSKRLSPTMVCHLVVVVGLMHR